MLTLTYNFPLQLKTFASFHSICCATGRWGVQQSINNSLHVIYSGSLLPPTRCSTPRLCHFDQTSIHNRASNILISSPTLSVSKNTNLVTLVFHVIRERRSKFTCKELLPQRLVTILTKFGSSFILFSVLLKNYSSIIQLGVYGTECRTYDTKLMSHTICKCGNTVRDLNRGKYKGPVFEIKTGEHMDMFY